MAMPPPGALPIRDGWVDLRHRRVRRDGQELRLSRLEAGLLGYLADRPSQEVSRDELLREVWGHAGTTTTRAVDLVVRRLREKLGDAEAQCQLLTAHGVGYQFVPLDVEPPRPASVAAAPRELFHTARGVLDLDRQSFARSDGVVVALSRTDTALLRRLTVTAGHPVAVEELAAEIWGRGRHRGSVVAAVARLRKKLEEDPADPQVLVTTRGLGVRLEGRVPEAPTDPSPVQSSFVEGASFGATVCAVAPHRLVTLCGTGGVGKSRLARQLGAAVRLADPSAEVWFCDLSSASDAHGIADAVAQQLGLVSEGSDLLGRIGRVLARRHPGSVLILDNYEHLVPFASVVAAWAAAAPDLRIRVTSRVPLGLPGEVCVDVLPLDDDAAARLFAERSAGRADAASPVVRALVRRLDGLPLAIELAAARSHQLRPEVLLARIGERLDLLVRPAAGHQSHHSTLRGAFDWSWDLLDADERRALAALSVLVTPFDGATATGLLGTDGPTLVTRLVSASLVHPHSGGRFRLLESIRDYAAEKLTLSGERGAVGARRADLFLGRAERLSGLSPSRPGGDPRDAWALRDEILSIGQSTADADTSARAALFLAALEETGPTYTPLGEMLTAAIARSPDVAHLWQLWWRLGAWLLEHEDVDRARAALDQAYTCAGERSVLAQSIVGRQIGLCEARAGRDGPAARWFHQARVSFLDLGERGWAARALCNLAFVELRAPVENRSCEMMAEAVAEVRASGELRLLPRLLVRQARGLLFRGDPVLAGPCLMEALTRARQARDLHSEIAALRLIASATLDPADGVRARARYLDLEEAYGAAGAMTQERNLRVARGGLALAWGDDAEAAALLADPGVGPESLDFRIEREGCLAVLALFAGDVAGAREILRSLRALRCERHFSFWIYNGGYLAVAAALDGDLGDAEAQLSEARGRVDRVMNGVPRFLALCEAVIDLLRTRGVDPVGAVARANAVLDAGVLVQWPGGRSVEVPEDVAFARRILVRTLRGV